MSSNDETEFRLAGPMEQAASAVRATAEALGEAYRPAIQALREAMARPGVLLPNTLQVGDRVTLGPSGRVEVHRDDT